MTTLVQPLPNLGAVHLVGMAGQQFGDVFLGWLVRGVVGFPDNVQNRGELPCVPTIMAGLYCEWDNAGGFYRGGDADGVSSSSSNICSNRMSRTSEASPRTARAAANAISQ